MFEYRRVKIQPAIQMNLAYGQGINEHLCEYLLSVFYRSLFSPIHYSSSHHFSFLLKNILFWFNVAQEKNTTLFMFMFWFSRRLSAWQNSLFWSFRSLCLPKKNKKHSIARKYYSLYFSIFFNAEIKQKFLRCENKIDSIWSHNGLTALQEWQHLSETQRKAFSILITYYSFIWSRK